MGVSLYTEIVLLRNGMVVKHTVTTEGQTNTVSFTVLEHLCGLRSGDWRGHSSVNQDREKRA